MRRLRERRAGGIEAAPDPPVRDAAGLLVPFVEGTLAALQLAARDQAAAQLARRYAALIDEARDPAWALRWIGPLLLRVLEELQATPKSRPAASARPGQARANKVAELRAAHAKAMAKRAG
jgi:hypothetical protein